MAILITAPLGTGKTLYTIQLIFEYLNQGRPVYSNIVGLKIPGVIGVDSTAHHPFDWRDLPNDAVLFFDEAHEHPAYSERDLLKSLTIDEYEQKLKQIDNLELTDTKKKALFAQTEKEYARALKRKKEDIIDIGLSMSMHRHFGQEIVLITQNPTKLNKDVLGNVTIHHVMRRKFGFEAANIWTFGEAMTTWGKSVADSALVKTYWRFPKHLYNFYVSSEKHNVKKYFPKKYYAYACIPLLIMYLGYHKARETGFFGLVPKGDTVKTEPVQPSTDMGYSAKIVELPEDDPKKHELEKLQAQNMGLTLEQYRDLKNPEKRNAEMALTQKQYDANNPFDYSYLQGSPVANQRVFSGCLNNTPYDQQGSILTDAPKDLCKRVLAGERPYNPYRQLNSTPPTMVTQTNIQPVSQVNTQVESKPNNQTLSPEDLAKFQKAKELGLI